MPEDFVDYTKNQKYEFLTNKELEDLETSSESSHSEEDETPSEFEYNIENSNNILNEK